jgi:hypothetical protein
LDKHINQDLEEEAEDEFDFYLTKVEQLQYGENVWKKVGGHFLLYKNSCDY